MSLPSHDEIRERTGHGIAIFLEGETMRDDPYFYGRWFNDQSPTFTFFACGSRLVVVEGVQLRQTEMPDVPIYGIIDRDFADDDEFEAFNNDFPQSRVLKTPKFTLENYLLDAQCWYQAFAHIYRDNPPDGWNSREVFERRIQQIYEDCLPLAAYNWVIEFGKKHYNDEYRKTPREHIKRLDVWAGHNPEDELLQWGQTLGASEDFAALYRNRLEWLRGLSLDEMEKFVSGEYVLHTLHQQFPRRQIPCDFYLNEYIDQCSQPPDDLKQLLQHIRIAAGR